MQKQKKRITIGFRCKILKDVPRYKNQHADWEEYVGSECIIHEMDSPGRFAFIPLEGRSELVMDGSEHYSQCAWIDEAQLEVVDRDVDKNMEFIDWVTEHEDDYCEDCLAFIPNKDTCPHCGYER